MSRIHNLSPADQAFSDRAVEAACAADGETRAAAHRMASEISPEAPLLERASLYGAFCYLTYWDRMTPDTVAVGRLARRLIEIHDKHAAAIEARAAA